MNFTHTHPLDASWGTYSVRPFKGRAGLLAPHLLPPACRTRVVFCQAPLLQANPVWLNLSGAQDSHQHSSWGCKGPQASSLHQGTAPRKTIAHKCTNTLYFLCQKNNRLIFQGQVVSSVAQLNPSIINILLQYYYYGHIYTIYTWYTAHVLCTVHYNVD